MIFPQYIPSFRYRDNSVHLHECSNAEAFLYVIEKSNITCTVCKHGNILLSLALKQNTISNFFYYIHIVEIPTNKGANSCKLNISKIGNCSKSAQSLCLHVNTQRHRALHLEHNCSQTLYSSCISLGMVTTRKVHHRF